MRCTEHQSSITGVGGRALCTWTSCVSHLIKKPTRAMLAKEVNDGQFGCESIESAVAILYAVYGYSAKVYEGEYEFTKKEIAMNGHGRRGI